MAWGAFSAASPKRAHRALSMNVRMSAPVSGRGEAVQEFNWRADHLRLNHSFSIDF